MVTTTATTTTSTATVSGSSILTSLGAGSGVDTAGLIKSLVDAQFAAKNASLSAQDRTPEQSDLAEMDRLWDEAKALEKAGASFETPLRGSSG